MNNFKIMFFAVASSCELLTIAVGISISASDLGSDFGMYLAKYATRAFLLMTGAMSIFALHSLNVNWLYLLRSGSFLSGLNSKEPESDLVMFGTSLQGNLNRHSVSFVFLFIL